MRSCGGRSEKQCFLFLLLISVFSAAAAAAAAATFSYRHGLTDDEARLIRRMQLLYYLDETGDRGERVSIDPSFHFENPRLRDAYIALQSWKFVMLSDPNNFTGNWVGPNVCSYFSVFCAQLPCNQSLKVVAGIDLNHADIAGYLPEDLGLLTDLALFHINSNRFRGTIPHTLRQMTRLFEINISNNRRMNCFTLY